MRCHRFKMRTWTFLLLRKRFPTLLKKRDFLNQLSILKWAHLWSSSQAAMWRATNWNLDQNEEESCLQQTLFQQSRHWSKMHDLATLRWMSRTWTAGSWMLSYRAQRRSKGHSKPSCLKSLNCKTSAICFMSSLLQICLWLKFSESSVSSSTQLSTFTLNSRQSCCTVCWDMKSVLIVKKGTFMNFWWKFGTKMSPLCLSKQSSNFLNLEFIMISTRMFKWGLSHGHEMIAKGWTKTSLVLAFHCLWLMV